MNVLLLNQFFPPDVAPTGQFLHDLARALGNRGHAVTVICSNRSYDGRQRYSSGKDGPRVTVIRTAGCGFGRERFLGKLADYLAFSISALVRLFTLKPRPDLILALTTPPYVGLLARLAGARHGAAHAHWLMDLYPDVMRAHGMLRTGSMLDRALSALTRMELRGSRLILTPGGEMARRAGAYSAKGAAGINWVPLWASDTACPDDGTAALALRAERGWAKGDVVAMYSGNMGLGHRFTEFLAAARQTATDRNLRWVFAGAGRKRVEIEHFVQAHPDANIELLPYVPTAQLATHLRSADIHLVSMEPAWQGCLIPSKLQNLFAIGAPVIFVGGRDNEIAQWLLASGGGWLVALDDVQGLLAALGQACDPAEQQRRGAAARAYAQQHFDRERNCGLICDLLESCVRPGAQNK